MFELEGFREQQSASSIIPPVSSFKKSSKKKKKVNSNKQTNVEEWFYQEVVWWRLLATYVWLAFFFIGAYTFVLMPFSLLSLYSTLLLFLCSVLIMFSQQSLRSTYRGETKDYTTIPIVGGTVCLIMGCFLSVLCIASESSSESMTIISECFEVRSEGRQPRNIYCLNEYSLCLILFSIYLSVFVTIRFWMHRQYVIEFPTINRGRWFRMKSRIPLMTQEAIHVTFLAVSTFFVFYFLWASFISATAVSLFSNIVHEAVYLHPQLWEDTMFSLPLLGTTSYCSLIFLFVFQWCIHTTDVFLTQAKRFEPGEGNKNVKWLLDGIASSDPQIQYLALLDLYNITKFDYDRRRVIFLNKEAWNIVFETTRKLIDGLTVRLQEEASSDQQSPKKGLFSRKTNSGENLFGNTQAVLWAIQSLSGLVALSKYEDSLGTVQNSIPHSLNSLLSCLTVLDRLVELEILETPSSLEDYQILHPYPYTIANTINTAIYRIITTWKDLSQYEGKLHPILRERLGTFAQFQR